MAGVVMMLPPIGGFLELMLDAGVGMIVYGVVAYALNAAGVRDFKSAINSVTWAGKRMGVGLTSGSSSLTICLAGEMIIFILLLRSERWVGNNLLGRSYD